MTTLNLNSFLDGAAASGTDVSENFYDPQSAVVATSFEVINGWMDSGNTEPTWTMDTYHLQPHALTEGRMVGATLNHDYFGEAFFKDFNGYKKVETIDAGPPPETVSEWVYIGEEGNHGASGIVPARDNPTGEHAFFTPIPGGGITFFVPFSTAFVVLTWNIRWTHDGEAIMTDDSPGVSLNEERAAVRLFVKTPSQPVAAPPGANYADNYRRVIGQVNVGGTVSGGLAAPDDRRSTRFDFSRHREWSGHYILGAASAQPSANPEVPVPGANNGVSAGWYSASLRIATSAKQARVQVRSMRYICFKLEAPSES